jgi:hypothetical protein
VIETTQGVAERLARAGAQVTERPPFSFEKMRAAWAAYLRCVGCVTR